MSDHVRPRRARAAALMVSLLVASACGAGAPDGAASASATAASPTASPSAAASSTGSPAVGSEVTPVDGIYTATVTEGDARAAGFPAGRFTEIVGDYELDLVRGQVVVYFTHGVTIDLLRGTYTVRDDALHLTSDEGLDQTYGWTREHGQLRLTLEQTSDREHRVLDELVFTTHPWERQL